MSERDKVAAWVVAIALMVGGYIWLGQQPASPGLCVQQGPELVCPE